MGKFFLGKIKISFISAIIILIVLSVRPHSFALNCDICSNESESIETVVSVENHICADCFLSLLGKTLNLTCPHCGCKFLKKNLYIGDRIDDNKKKGIEKFLREKEKILSVWKKLLEVSMRGINKKIV